MLRGSRVRRRHPCRLSLDHGFCGLTQGDLEKETGVNAAYISAYENGKYLPQSARESIQWWLERQWA